MTYLAASLLMLTVEANSAPSSEGGPQWIAEEHLGKPLFEMRAVHRVNMPGEPNRVDVMFDVVYDYLQFVRVDSINFEASIEAAIAISKQDSGQVLKQVKTITKRLPDFAKTNSRREFISGLFQVELPAGKYKIELRLTDRESKRGDSIIREIVLGNGVHNELALSDLILSRSNDIVLGMKFPKDPTIEGVALSGDQTLHVFFDVFCFDPTTPTKINLALKDKTGAVVAVDSVALVGGDPLTFHSMALNAKSLTFGRYELRLNAESGTHRAEKSLFFNLNLNGLPGTISDLDEAIKQLKYIATEEEIKEIDAQFPSEREAAFIAFWNEKFPVEGEAVNGKMLEYYARVSFANENFSGSTVGWETDRGKVMMLFGKPSEVERFEETNTEPASEVWYYSSLGRRFVFRDEYGFGDFRLTTPIW